MKTNKGEITGSQNLKAVTLSSLPIPPNFQPDTDSDKWATYGLNNSYPDFLLSLYEDSSTHGGIVNGKATHIMGGGLRIVGATDPLAADINLSEPIGDFLRKITLDFLIFTYFCVEVTYNKFNQPVQYKWIPAQCIRTNKRRTKFWYRENWKRGGTTVTFEPFDPEPKTDASRLFFYDGYYPSRNNVYPAIEYNSCIISILVEQAIKKFNLNNITNHFSVSTLITFFMGTNLPDETKEEVVTMLKKRYTGEEGSKLIVDFQAANGKAAEVSNIDPNTWDEAYSVIAKDTKEDIVIGHAVVSPLLVGIKTEGQLGGATELETSYEIFKITYVDSKRKEIVDGLNRLFRSSTIIKGQVEIIDVRIFSTSLTETGKMAVYTIDELRALDGLPPLPNGAGQRLVTEPAAVVTPIAQSIDTSEASEYVPPAKDRKGWVKKSLTDADFEKVVNIGLDKDMFEIVGRGSRVRSALHAHMVAVSMDMEQDVAKHIVDGRERTLTLDKLLAELKDKGLDITKDGLIDVLDKINNSEVAKISIDEKGKIKISPDKTKEPTGNLLTMYEYELRPNVPGPDIIPGSRGFCRKLIANNKLYTRADIQSMSGIFGYDVFQHAGGWWHDPQTGDNEDHCRHQFSAVRVRRKTT